MSTATLTKKVTIVDVVRSVFDSLGVDAPKGKARQTKTTRIIGEATITTRTTALRLAHLIMDAALGVDVYPDVHVGEDLINITLDNDTFLIWFKCWA